MATARLEFESITTLAELRQIDRLCTYLDLPNDTIVAKQVSGTHGAALSLRLPLDDLAQVPDTQYDAPEDVQ